MKIHCNMSKVAVTVAAGLASACTLAAQDMNAGSSQNAGSMYVTGSGGVAFLQNMTIRDEDTLLQWKAGPSVDLSAGYNITENIAAELQSGFAVNGLSKVDGNSGVGSAHLWTIPVMANGIYNYALNDKVQLYGGLGAGVLIGKFDLQPGFSATDCDFGYQAMVGMKYNICDHWQAGLGYIFTGSLDNHWNFQDEGSITTSPTYMHTILLSLTYKF